MPIPLIIKGTTYQYSIPGEDPNWGQENTDWAQAVTNVLNTIVSDNDILETTATIANNIAIPTNVSQLQFDIGSVRAANIDYAIYRTSNDNPSGFSETGTIYLIYDDVPASWQLSQRSVGNSEVVFSITSLGQIQYVSSDLDPLSNGGYSGIITFQAKTLSK